MYTNCTGGNRGAVVQPALPETGARCTVVVLPSNAMSAAQSTLVQRATVRSAV